MKYLGFTGKGLFCASICLSVIFLMVFALMGVFYSTVFGGYFPEHDEWDPVEKSVHFASILLEADNVHQVENAIHDILELIGIGVYDVYGMPIRIGNESSEDDFFLYDFETRLLAESFLKGTYLSLEAVAESWQSMGIPIVPLGSQGTELVSALEVEKGLRTLREAAEDNPESSEGFIVRLIDELGNREEFPFDLLDEEDDEPEIEGLAPGMKEMVQEQLDMIRQEAEEDGDHEMLARLEILESEAGQRALMEAMIEGDMFRMMQLLMGEAAIEELGEMMKEQTQEMRQDEDIPEGLFQYIDTASQFFSGQDVDFIQANIDFLKDEMEHYDRQWEKGVEEAREEISDTYKYINDLPATRYARAVYDLNSLVSQSALHLDGLQDRYEYLSNIVEPWEEEYEDMKEIMEEMESKFGLPTLDEEEVSRLHFDPIQSLLLHIDMFLEPRDMMVASGHTGSTERYVGGIIDGMQTLWSYVIPSVHAGGNPCSIGDSQGRYSDAYGGLNNLLSTSRSVRGIIKDIRNVGLNRSYTAAAKNIVRGAIQTAATEIHVDVYYVVDRVATKAGPDNPNAHIHMRHGEERPSRYIRIEARIESPFLDALSDLLSQVDPTRACGPIRDLLGAPDPLGSLHDIADHDMSGVSIRFEPESEFLFEHLLYASEWDYVRGTTFTKKTNEEGIANGIFYLNKETPDVGGWTEVTPGAVRVQAMVNASEAAIYNPASWGLAVGEEIFRPVQTHVQIRVEHHVPVQRTGTLTLTRTVTETGSTSDFDQSGYSMLSRNGRATLTLNITNLVMDEEGNMTADYNGTLTGNWEIVDTVGHYPENGDGSPSETVVTTKGNFTGSASGTSKGVEFRVNSRNDTYLVWPGPLLAELMARMTIRGQTTVKREVTGDDGREPDEPESDPIRGIGDLEEFIVNHIFDHSALFIGSKPFDRGYDLSDSVHARRVIPNDELRSLLGRQPADFMHTITTNVEWNLRGVGVR